jgi:hypothetical protein
MRAVSQWATGNPDVLKSQIFPVCRTWTTPKSTLQDLKLFIAVFLMNIVKMGSLKATTLISFLSLTSAQQIGTSIPERHPPLTTYKCTLASGCKAVDTAIVLDAFARPLHSISSPSTACNVGSAPLCDTAEACAQNCALEGID